MNSPPCLQSVIGPCRSGTTLFLNMLCQPPAGTEEAEVYGLFQPVKSGLRYGVGLDYRVYETDTNRQHPAIRQNPGRRAYLLKEAVGHSKPQECQLRVFPDDDALRRTRPLFLFRDPVATFNSWKAVPWGNLTLFQMAYCHAYHLYRYASAASTGVTALTYEHFLTNRDYVLQTLCRRLTIDFRETMVTFRHHFLQNPNVWLHPGTRRDNEATNHHQNIANTTGIARGLVRRELLVTWKERSEIESALRPLYEEMAAAAERDYPAGAAVCPTPLPTRLSCASS